MVPSVYPSGDPSSVPSYVPSVNPYRYPHEQHVRALQEERRTTIEQSKSLESITASGEIKIEKATQLRELALFACWRLMLKKIEEKTKLN